MSIQKQTEKRFRLKPSAHSFFYESRVFLQREVNTLEFWRDSQRIPYELLEEVGSIFVKSGWEESSNTAHFRFNITVNNVDYSMYGEIEKDIFPLLTVIQNAAADYFEKLRKNKQD